NLVLNRNGAVLYKIPNYDDAYYFTSKSETRFAVYEQGRSVWHQLSDGSYDRMRVVVHSLVDGRKLFEYRWKQEKDEAVGFGNMSLSDDGSKLFLDRTTKQLTFDIPPDKRH